MQLTVYAQTILTSVPSQVSKLQQETIRGTLPLSHPTQKDGEGPWAVLQRLPFGKLLNKPGTMFTDRLQCKRWHRLTYTRSRGQRLHGLGRIQWLWKNFGICQHEDLKSTLTPTHPHACGLCGAGKTFKKFFRSANFRNLSYTNTAPTMTSSNLDELCEPRVLLERLRTGCTR